MFEHVGAFFFGLTALLSFSSIPLSPTTLLVLRDVSAISSQGTLNLHFTLQVTSDENFYGPRFTVSPEHEGSLCVIFRTEKFTKDASTGAILVKGTVSCRLPSNESDYMRLPRGLKLEVTTDTWRAEGLHPLSFGLPLCLIPHDLTDLS